MISIICPTITGREAWLERCWTSYCETTPDAEFIIVNNAPTCNQGWNIGIEEARGEYIHLTADDIEAKPGWSEVAIEWVEHGHIPCPRVVNPDGSLQSCGDGDWEADTGTPANITRVPFFSREQMEKAGIYPIIPCHYFGDLWVTHRGRFAGFHTYVVRELEFIHSYANVGRLDERMEEDLEVYREACARDGVLV